MDIRQQWQQLSPSGPRSLSSQLVKWLPLPTSQSPKLPPVHTSAHHPSVPATLSVTLHIPPHNPTCLFTPWLPHAPSEPLPYPLDNTLLSTPTQLPDYFLHFAPPQASPFFAGCPAAWLYPAPSWSTPRVLLPHNPEPSHLDKSPTPGSELTLQG